MMTHGRGGSDLWGSSLSDSSSEAVVMHGAFITSRRRWCCARPTLPRAQPCRRAWFAGRYLRESRNTASASIAEPGRVRSFLMYSCKRVVVPCEPRGLRAARWLVAVSHTVCGQKSLGISHYYLPDKSPPISAGASFLTGAAVHDSQCPQRGDSSAGHADAASLQWDA